MIPLEEDGTPHQCPKSDYGKGGSGGFTSTDSIAELDTKLEKVLAKMDEFGKTRLKLILAVQTVQMRIEGQTTLPVGQPDQVGNVEKGA